MFPVSCLKHCANHLECSITVPGHAHCNGNKIWKIESVQLFSSLNSQASHTYCFDQSCSFLLLVRLLLPAPCEQEIIDKHKSFIWNVDLMQIKSVWECTCCFYIIVWSQCSSRFIKYSRVLWWSSTTRNISSAGSFLVLQDVKLQSVWPSKCPLLIHAEGKVHIMPPCKLCYN